MGIGTSMHLLLEVCQGDMQVIKVFLALFFVILIFAPAASWWFAQRPVPVLDGVGEIAGLHKPVLVRYDSRAIPYLKAESEDDVFAAQGYVVARERMFQMDMLRRAAEGRTAEIFGITALPADRLMRTIGFDRLASEEIKFLRPEAKTALESYCRGVNAYLADSSDKLPLEFTLLGYKPEPWREVDTLAVMKYLSYELDESWKLDELRFRAIPLVGDNFAKRLFKDDYALSSWTPDLRNAPAAPVQKTSLRLSPDLSKNLISLSRQESFFRQPAPNWGSTAWVLSPALSKSGGALIAGDKHAKLSYPAEYFLISLNSPGIHLVGAALPGIPGILFGRNEQIAWSSSSMRADVQDLFVEHFDTEFGTKYKAISKVETATESREVIPVRFGKDVEHKVTLTKHGPILLRDKESAVALSWSGFQTKLPNLNALYAMNKANDWMGFNQALRSFSGSPQLFVFADRRGNVGCHAAGLIPVRAAGGDGTSMSEGWLSKGEWISTISYDDLPQTFIPAGSAGRVAGDFCVAAGQKLIAPASMLWGHQWQAPYRANRLALSLPRGKTAQKLDLFDFTAYQGDELNMIGPFVRDELKKSMDANKSIDATQLSALQLMQNWDGSLKKDSPAASIYESFVGVLARRLIEPKLGASQPKLARELANDYFQRWPLWITLVEDYLRNKPKDMLPTEERTHDTFMLTTFAKSNTRLKLLFKTDKVESWSWDKAHIARFKAIGFEQMSVLRSVLDIGGVGVGGDSDTLNSCDVDRTSVGGIFQSLNGPSVRLLIDLADNDVIYGSLAPGQSGHYMSPNKQDQLKSWLKADPLPIAFSETQIDKQCRQKFYLAAPGYK